MCGDQLILNRLDFYLYSKIMFSIAMIMVLELLPVAIWLNVVVIYTFLHFFFLLLNQEQYFTLYSNSKLFPLAFLNIINTA